MILHLVALLVLGLMCGSELNVALFSHPVLKRQPLETRIGSLIPRGVARESHAVLDGRLHATQSIAAPAFRAPE